MTLAESLLIPEPNDFPLSLTERLGEEPAA